MGRLRPTSPTENNGVHKTGTWTKEEDEMLVNYIQKHGHSSWRVLAENSGLKRCGKSCRLRWNNYLKPGIIKGNITPDEEQTILILHSILGNKWSAIASYLPGRTDNEIKNIWNTRLRKKLVEMGIDPVTHRPVFSTSLCSLILQVQALLQASIVDENYPLDDRTMMFRSEAIKLTQICLNLLLPVSPPLASTSNSLINTLQFNQDIIMNSTQTIMDQHHPRNHNTQTLLIPNVIENDDHLLLQEYIDNPPPISHFPNCQTHTAGENTSCNSLDWLPVPVSLAVTPDSLLVHTQGLEEYQS